MSRGRKLVLATGVAVAALIIGGAGFLVTSTAFRSTDNTETIRAIQTDRAARIAAACVQAHKDFIAAQEAYEAQQATLDLIDGLLHQSSPDDPKVQAILTPDQVEFLRDQLIESERKLTAARQKVDTAHALVAQTDCTPKETR